MTEPRQTPKRPCGYARLSEMLHVHVQWAYSRRGPRIGLALTAGFLLMSFAVWP